MQCSPTELLLLQSEFKLTTGNEAGLTSIMFLNMFRDE